jgi:endoglucanase
MIRRHPISWRAALGVLGVVVCMCANVAGARAGSANAGLPGASLANPIAGLAWGVYTGRQNNNVYPIWQRTAGPTKQLLARIALEPTVSWFGAWQADTRAAASVREYIASTTHGNPDVLAQIAVFRLAPWEGQACPGSWSSSSQASYRTWIKAFAAGIGSSRVALILQPDLPFAVCARSPTPLRLVSWAARLFSALPHTSVYIDGGARWFPMRITQAVSMLAQAGVRYARGFALNTTEYDATGAELEYGASIIHRFRAAGYGSKHMVINTAENGSPFLNGQYPGDVTNPRACRSRHDHLCATLGIPPTTDVDNPRWGLSRRDRSIAHGHADAYLWIGRPWLAYGAAPFDMTRALALAASTPLQ